MKEEIIGSPDLEGIIRIVEGYDRSRVTSSSGTSKEDPFSRHFKFDPSEYRTIRDEDRSAGSPRYYRSKDGTSYTPVRTAASPKKEILTTDDFREMYETVYKDGVDKDMAEKVLKMYSSREAKADPVVDDSPKTDSAEVGSW